MKTRDVIPTQNTVCKGDDAAMQINSRYYRCIEGRISCGICAFHPTDCVYCIAFILIKNVLETRAADYAHIASEMELVCCTNIEIWAIWTKHLV